jgi:hypothetical protein
LNRLWMISSYTLDSLVKLSEDYLNKQIW